jgi:phosphatidate cytidylyltransferase
MSAVGDRWGDLRTRVISAGVMLAVGAAEIWLGGPTFTVLVMVLILSLIHI